MAAPTAPSQRPTSTLPCPPTAPSWPRSPTTPPRSPTWASATTRSASRPRAATPAAPTSSIDCKTIHLLKLTLSPATADNELGTDHSHTVTATLHGDAAYVAAHPRVVDFTVGGQNAGETGTCSPNADCSTDASGVVTFTYTVPVAPDSLGTDSIEACLEIAGDQVCRTVEKNWVDTTPPEVSCREYVNPHGKNIPPAGRRCQDPRAARTRTASTSSRPTTTSGRPLRSTSTSTASGGRAGRRSAAATSSSTPRLTAPSRAARRSAAPTGRPAPSWRTSSARAMRS